MEKKNDLIIVVVGETGSGKSWMMKEVLSKYPNIRIIKKYTTRKSRVDERNNIETQGNMSFEEVSQMQYTYVNPKNKELYGFKFDDINSAINDGLIPCLGVSDEQAYLSISNDFSDKRTLLLKVVPYFDEESMKDTFDTQGRDPLEFEQRKSVLEEPLTDWAYNYKNMREVINPYFLRKVPSNISTDVIVKRIEHIIQNECQTNLGASFIENNNFSGIYNYLYSYSKNRPIDQELVFKNNPHK